MNSFVNLKDAMCLAQDLLILLFALNGLGPVTIAADEPDIIYATGFERSEGFDPELTLVGQNGWVGEGTGGNGLLDEFFPGFGQQTFVGFAPPEKDDLVLNVWRPVNLSPIPANRPVLKFTVLMQIAASTNGHGDDFRWSVYNTNGARLFTLDFDNSTREINYALDDERFVSTGKAFDNLGVYDLELYLNFARNTWTARLNGVVVTSSSPITTKGAALNLGDVDAVWAIRTPNEPGDNFMVFDDYRITAEPVQTIPPFLEALKMVEGQFQFRFYGETGLDYVIEVTSDFSQWFALGTYRVPASGDFDFLDTTAPQYGRGFYRARLAQ